MINADLDRVEQAAAVGNSPLWFGEWAITTNFAATDEFLKKWADAQKLAYSKLVFAVTSCRLTLMPRWYFQG